MNPESFEKRLQAARFQRIPAEWRSELLATARREARSLSADATAPTAPGRLEGIRRMLLFFWRPSPQGWAAVAAVWVGLLVLSSVSAGGDRAAQATARRSPTIVTGLREQRQALAELSGGLLSRDAEPPSAPSTPVPGPRSQVRGRNAAV